MESRSQISEDGATWGRKSVTLFDEQTFQKIRGASGTAVCDGHAQVGDAGLEVIHEAGDGGGQLLLEVRDDAFGKVSRDRPTWA